MSPLHLTWEGRIRTACSTCHFLLHVSSCHSRWSFRKWPEQRALCPSDSAKSTRQCGMKPPSQLAVHQTACRSDLFSSLSTVTRSLRWTAVNLAWAETAKDSETCWIQNPSLLVEIKSVLVCAAVSFHSIWNGFLHPVTSITSLCAVVNIRLWLYSFLPFPCETCPHPLKTHSRPSTGQYRQNHISN